MKNRLGNKTLLMNMVFRLIKFLYLLLVLVFLTSKTGQKSSLFLNQEL